MALTSEERISISRKIIEIPLQNASADLSKAQVNAAKVLVEKEDGANKALIENLNVLINPYQAELNRYDGNLRNELLEQDFQNSANKLFKNPFFPNDPNTNLPNVSENTWRNFVPFSGNIAIGKKYDETYVLAPSKEQDLINDIKAQITIIENSNPVQRSTGQECVVGFPDQIVPNTTMQDASSAINTAVGVWEDFIAATKFLVPTAIQDPNASRLAENDASRQNITDTVSVIDDWLELPNFDTGHGATTCAVFNNIDVNTLDPTKYRTAELQVLKDAIASREGFLTTRVNQILGHLGSIDQNFTTGAINSATGFYGDRFKLINIRLNLIGGSLTKLNGLQGSQDAQDQLKDSNNNALQAYSSVILVTPFIAPASGIATIHVKDTTGFSLSDSVFVVSNDRAEISATISGISGNAVILSTAIPKNYRQDEGARLYKVL